MGTLHCGSKQCIAWYAKSSAVARATRNPRHCSLCDAQHALRRKRFMLAQRSWNARLEHLTSSHWHAWTSSWLLRSVSLSNRLATCVVGKTRHTDQGQWTTRVRPLARDESIDHLPACAAI